MMKLLLSAFARTDNYVTPPSAFQNPFIIWFNERFFLIQLVFGSVVILHNTFVNGAWSDVGIALAVAWLCWTAGYISYRVLSIKKTEGKKRQKIEFLRSFLLLVSIYFSIYLQAKIGLETILLWPLWIPFMIPASNILSGLDYLFFIILIGVGLVLQEKNPTVLISGGHAGTGLTHYLIIIFLAVTLRYYSLTLRSQNRGIRSLLRLFEDQYRWNEFQFSSLAYKNMIEITKSLFNATSCEIIYYNHLTGYCYVPITIKDKTISKSLLTREFIKPIRKLKESIETGRPQWESIPTKKWLVKLLKFLASNFIPLGSESILYIPIYNQDKPATIGAVLKIFMRASPLITKLNSDNWSRSLQTVSKVFSEVIDKRERFIFIHVMDRWNRISLHNPSSTLYTTIVNDLAYMFTAPVTLWTKPYDTHKLVCTGQSLWFNEDSTRSELISQLQINIGKAAIGSRLSTGNKSRPNLFEIKTEESEIGKLSEVGVKKIICLPVLVDSNVEGLICLNVLNENHLSESLGEKDQRLLQICGERVSLAFERHYKIKFSRNLPNIIRGSLRQVTEENLGFLQFISAQSHKILQFDVLDVHIIESEKTHIQSSFRLEENSMELKEYEPSREEENALLKFNNPFFIDTTKRSYKKIFPPDIVSYAVLPIRYGRTIQVILVSKFNYPKSFSSNSIDRSIHEYFLLLAEHIYNLEFQRQEIRKRSSLEESQRISIAIHSSVADSILAIRNWADGLKTQIDNTMLIESDITTNNTDEAHFQINNSIRRIKSLAMDSYDKLINLSDRIWSANDSDLLQFGFEQSLELYFQKFNTETHLQTNILTLALKNIPIDVQGELLRLCKIALSNTSR